MKDINSVFPARYSNTQWWYMTTCHHSSCRSSVGVCWWHPPSSPEDRGSQQSHVSTLSPWHVAPSGSPTNTHTWIHKHNLHKQRHCHAAVEAGPCSGDSFHSKLHYFCTGQMSQQISGRLWKYDFSADIFGYYPDTPSKCPGCIQAASGTRQLSRSAGDEHVHSNYLWTGIWVVERYNTSPETRVQFTAEVTPACRRSSGLSGRNSRGGTQ